MTAPQNPACKSLGIGTRPGYGASWVWESGDDASDCHIPVPKELRIGTLLW